MLLINISSFKYKTTAAFSVENSYFEKMLEHMLYAVQLEISNESITPVYENSINPVKQTSSDVILEYIKSNLADITLEKTAKHFGYSTMSIHRIIKAQTGSSFTVYVSKQRINLAKYLLKKTNLPIGEIAIRTGCSTSEYFGKFFKKHVFKTPSKYRKEYLKTPEDIIS